MYKTICRFYLNLIVPLEERNIKPDTAFIEAYEKGLTEYKKYLPAEEIESYRKRLEAIK